MPHLRPPVTVELPARAEPLDPQAFFTTEGKMEASEEFKSLVLPASEKIEAAPAYHIKSYAILNESTPEQLISELPKDRAFSATEFLRIAAYVAEWGRTDWGIPREGPLYDQDSLFFVRGVDDVEYACSIVWENSEDHHVLPSRSYWKIYTAGMSAFLEKSAYSTDYQAFAPIR